MHHHHLHHLPALSLDAPPSLPHLHVAAAAASSGRKAGIQGIWLQRLYLQESCVFSRLQSNSYSQISPCRTSSGTPPDLHYRSERVPEKHINGSSQAGSDAEKVRTLRNSKVYPIMRTYRNDLCVTVLIGDANPSQVLEAMATDGGLTAAEDIASGRVITTIETILPGHGDEHSTIATKLLAPSTLVIERAKASWHEKASSMYSRWALKNAIARAFEVVVMTELLKFELCIQSPGSFRNMKSLPNEKMNVVARLESSDLNALKGISETVFSYMMAGISQNFEERGMESRSWIKPRFPWEKSHSLPTLKSAFQLLPLSETEISAHVDEKVKLFTLKEIASTEPVMASRIWWPIQKSTMLFISSKVIASESWIHDHVPVHRLVANLDVITADVQGGHKNGSLWEMQLTHAQLVDLANLLDLYYEDRYTCQHKRLPNEHNVIPPYYSRSKGFLALPFKVLFGFVGAFMLVGLFILSRRGNFAVLSQITKDGLRGFSISFQKLLVWRNPLTCVKSKVLLSKIPKVSPKELETLCVLVTAMVKDTFQWPQDIESSLERGAWMGKDLTGFERRISKDDTESPATSRMEASHFCLPEELGTQGVHTEAFVDDPKQNILVFKVTVSKYGKLVKIQPVNRSAITCWSNYPLTEWLHTDVTTGPGFVKHGLELSLPLEDDAVIELIVQHDESSPAVSARPFHL